MPATFEGTLARNLQFGHILEICAKAQPDGTWFNITLAAKAPKNETKIEVGLQMLVYLNVNNIALKTGDSEWQEVINEDFPTSLFFEQFKINIVMTENNFNLNINQRTFKQIPYKLPLNILNTVKITGDLECIKQMDHRQFFPYTWPPLQLADEKAAFSNDQPMSFEPGHVMIISAQLEGNKHGRLVLQIKSGRDNTHEELHVSARFDSKKFIRNSKNIKNKDKHSGVSYYEYGSEDASGGWPFKNFSAPFKLAIAFTDTHFLIAKDGKNLCKFPYRTKDVMPDLVGIKIRGNDGLIVKVSGIDHIQLGHPECYAFEKYTKLEKKNWFKL